ncbi:MULTISPECIES: hypothetical protein [Actinomadura]|jgi:hypothetical protein|uniref:Uncharacterized protein n=1 Tax=Actinomadura citrea TaxID=46158 RepID=A0A7Y9KAA3_9ACTN|nr:hypothetical protein [Actinomadura citrea]NYE09951.1 hypothetical protein [Actinomadura citrea]GGT68907.1 hypothetical protein GCM10010177_27870 [Actinomadura citrea]
MSRLVDRLLERVAPKATASAGCSYSNYCYRTLYMRRMCCLDQGCQSWVIGACG